MKKIIVLIAYAIVPFGATSQSILTVTDIPYLSGAQFSPEFATAISFNGNPAVSPQARGVGFGMYSEKKFMTEGLNALVLSAAIFRERSAFGIGLHYFGNPEYNEIISRINYSKSLGRINIGAGVSYTILSIAGFSRQSAPGINLSCTWKLSENIYAGLQLCDPPVSKKAPTRKASLYRTGFGYQASSKVYTGFEIYKEENKSAAVVAILQYHFANSFFVRAGFISASSMPYFGMGWKWNNIRMEIIASQHYALGVTPGILLNYQNQVQ